MDAPTYQPSLATLPNPPPTAEIALLPGNIALLQPPAAQLESLRDFQCFILPESIFQRDPLGAKVPDDHPKVTPGPMYPAGLVPRLRAALKAEGYQVSVTDRRPDEPELLISREFCQKSTGRCRALLRAALAQTLGQVEVVTRPGLFWAIAQLCCVFPEAQTLIVVPNAATANDLYRDLSPVLGESVMVFKDRYFPVQARCLVSIPSKLPRLTTYGWQMVLVMIINRSMLSEATCCTVLSLGARRTHALVRSHLGLGQRTRLRLEAMAGGLIHQVEW